MISFASLLLLSLAAAPLWGQATTDAVERRVRAELAERWRVAPDQVRLEWGRWPDERLADDVPFRVQGQGSDGRFVLVLRPDSAPRAVPLRAGIADSGWVAARPLTRGTRIGFDDVRTVESVRWGAAASETGSPMGWEVQRPLAEGQPLKAPAVAPPAVIEAGDPVRMTWRQGTVALQVMGVAMNRARLGERVRVKVEGRTGRLSGTANGPGTATLGGDDS